MLKIRFKRRSSQAANVSKSKETASKSSAGTDEDSCASVSLDPQRRHVIDDGQLQAGTVKLLQNSDDTTNKGGSVPPSSRHSSSDTEKQLRQSPSILTKTAPTTKSTSAQRKTNSSSALSFSRNHPIKNHSKNITTSVVDKTSSPIAGTAKVRADVTSSHNKAVISTTLPPHEIEITEVDGCLLLECSLCVLRVNFTTTPDLEVCGHRVCQECMQRYLKTEINNSRLNITCPICSEPLPPNVIRAILNDDKFYAKYESFMLRKVLAAEPDARWCPAPDCGYAVLANGCASCPRLVCGRSGCNTAFCYHCKQVWHPNQTCSAASIQRNKRGLMLDTLNIGDLIEEHNSTSEGPSSSQQRKTSKASQNTISVRPDDIKECPVCSSRIIKMNDGSCNHMTCSICAAEFCWLCMKEISDLHYFSPSGCTFWGKKPWSRKKKLLWRLGMLVGAPICIIFIAGIAVPAIVIGIPVWAARKLHTRLEKKQFSRYRKNAIVTGGVLLSFIVSPIISAMALAIGIPILLGYVYGVVPLSLCRSSGGCLSASSSTENVSQQFVRRISGGGGVNGIKANGLQSTDIISIGTATSNKFGNPSIDQSSIYLSNMSIETNSIGHVTTVEREDRESASNVALAGSMIGSVVDDANSTKALAGSIKSKESGGYTLVPAEIHIQQSQQLHNNQTSAIAAVNHYHLLRSSDMQHTSTKNASSGEQGKLSSAFTATKADQTRANHCAKAEKSGC